MQCAARNSASAARPLSRGARADRRAPCVISHLLPVRIAARVERDDGAGFRSGAGCTLIAPKAMPLIGHAAARPFFLGRQSGPAARARVNRLRDRHSAFELELGRARAQNDAAA